MKITCVIVGILAEVVITWYNIYGKTEIWSNHHFIRIILFSAILCFFIEIIKSARILLIAGFFSLGVVIAILGAMILDLAQQNVFSSSGLTDVFLYILSVFAASLVGAFLGRLTLKDKYKE